MPVVIVMLNYTMKLIIFMIQLICYIVYSVLLDFAIAIEIYVRFLF